MLECWLHQSAGVGIRRRSGEHVTASLEAIAGEPWTAPTIDEWADTAIADEHSEPHVGQEFMESRESVIRGDVEYWKRKAEKEGEV